MSITFQDLTIPASFIFTDPYAVADCLAACDNHDKEARND